MRFWDYGLRPLPGKPSDFPLAQYTDATGAVWGSGLEPQLPCSALNQVQFRSGLGVSTPKLVVPWQDDSRCTFQEMGAASKSKPGLPFKGNLDAA